MGLEEPTTGTVTLPDRVGMLKQNIEDFRNDTVIDVVIMGNKRLWDAMKERDGLYEEEMTDEVGMRLREIEGIIAEEDGYSAESNAEMLLSGMGVPKEFLQPKNACDSYRYPIPRPSLPSTFRRTSSTSSWMNRLTTWTWNRSVGSKDSFMNTKEL